VNCLFAAEQLVAETEEHTKKFVNTLQKLADQAKFFPKMCVQKFFTRLQKLSMLNQMQICCSRECKAAVKELDNL